MNYVIIGNGAAAANAIEAIRESDQLGSIVVISGEEYETYGRPLISYWLAGKVPDKGLPYRPAGFYQKHRVDLRLGIRASSIDTAAKLVLLSDGGTVAYDKLLIASGGRPIEPPMEGSDEVPHYSFMTLDDAKAIDKVAQPGGRALVVGGGFIGLKAAEALTHRGVHVELVEKADWLLPSMLDETAAGLVQEEIEKSGVKVRAGVVVVRVVKGDDGGIVAYLSDGTTVVCDFLVVAVGVVPDTELAVRAGIGVGRGVLVDEFMQTDVPDVYAAGDVVESLDVLSGRARVSAIMPNATRQGRVAGMSMTGKQVAYEGSVPFNSVGIFGVVTIAIGDPSGTPEGCEVCVDSREGSYRKLIISAGQIRGALFVNDLDRAGIVQGLVRQRIDVTPFKAVLLTGDLSLISWPAELRASKLAK